MVKTIAGAGAAGLVFFFLSILVPSFAKRTSGTAGIVLFASSAVLFLCLFVWLILDRADDHRFWSKMRWTKKVGICCFVAAFVLFLVPAFDRMPAEAFAFKFWWLIPAILFLFVIGSVFLLIRV